LVKKIAFAFEPDGVIIPVDQLVALRKLPPHIRSTEKYKCILASVREVGVIEPLIAFEQKDVPNQYLLLDGTIRLDILKYLGETEAFCLKATEDEAFTYNHKVNRLSPIQEHMMIMKALRSGLSEERIAAALNVDVAAVRRKRDLLTGICLEAVQLLKDKRVSPVALREIKRVGAIRQIEMAEVMISTNNYTSSLAKCLYAATPEEQKLAEDKPLDEHGLSPEDVARMQRELSHVCQELKLIEETHGENVLNLVVAVGYLRTMLSNNRVVKFLGQHYAAILTEFQKILEAPELDGASGT
jgi:hypothetical protein